MRAHTAPGTVRTLALAPEPTATGFLGNRIRGSAPARGTGARPLIPGGIARGGEGVIVRDALVVAVVGAVVAVRAEDVVASLAAGESAPPPARTRQVRALAVMVALAVLLRAMVRSVRLGIGRGFWPPPSLPWPFAQAASEAK